MDIGTAAFWLALGQIIIADLLLAGDNAVVIALAVRSLPAAQQKKAIIFGTVAAVVMRVALTIVAAQLLTFPYLKLIGAVLLLYVAVGLLLPDDHDEESLPGAKGLNGSMTSAIRTILIADLVMSLDNVIAVAAASRGDNTLLILGLLISIPLVVYGSTLLLKVIERYPVIIWAGAALLGYVAGDIAVHDPAIESWVAQQAAALGVSVANLGRIAGLAGAMFVLGLSKVVLNRRKVAAL
jgi:YjbE family integral membrane protein